MEEKKFQNKIGEIDALIQRVASQLDAGTIGTGAEQLGELLATSRLELETLVEELKVAEEELRQQNEELAAANLTIAQERQRFINLFEYAPDGYLVTDAKGIIYQANQTAIQMLEVPANFLEGKPFSVFILEEDRRLFRQVFHRLSENQPIKGWEIRIQPRSSPVFTSSLAITAVDANSFLPSGDPSQSGKEQHEALLWSIRDISQQKQAESEIRRQAAQIKLMQEIAFAANTSPTAENALQFAIDRICAFTHWPVGHVYLAEAQKKPVMVSTDIWHLDRPKEFQPFVETTTQTRLSFDQGLTGKVRSSGRPLWIEDVNLEPGFMRKNKAGTTAVKAGIFIPVMIDQQVGGVLEFFSEESTAPDPALLQVLTQLGMLLGRVIERRQAERAIRERETWLRQILTSASLILIAVDEFGLITLIEGKGLQVLGVDRSQYLGYSVEKLIPNRADLQAYLRQTLEGQEVSAVITVGSEPGEVIEARFSPQYNPQGEVVGAILVGILITEKIQAEQALHQSEIRFRRIFEQSEIGIMLVDPQGYIVACNPAIQKMLGYNNEDLIHKQLLDLFVSQEVSHSSQAFQALISREIEEFRMENRLLRKDGEPVWTSIQASLFVGQEPETHYGMIMVDDISAQKRMQAQLGEVERRLIDGREAERLQLAQNLHDGPIQDLHSVIFQLQPLRNELDDENMRHALEIAEKTVKEVIHTLRSSVVEMRPPTLEYFGLAKTIDSYINHLQESHPELHFGLDLMDDSDQLSYRMRMTLFRIFQHGLVNVIRHAQATHVLIHFAIDAENIELSIQDNGKGFRVPETLTDLVQEDHFGLAGALERTQAVGGRLQVLSRPGEGTLMRAVIPLTKDEPILTARFATRIARKNPPD